MQSSPPLQANILGTPGRDKAFPILRTLPLGAGPGVLGVYCLLQTLQLSLQDQLIWLSTSLKAPGTLTQRVRVCVTLPALPVRLKDEFGSL